MIICDSFTHALGESFAMDVEKEISSQTVQHIVDQVQTIPSGKKIMILAPIARERKGEFKKEILDIKRKGFVRARIDGEVRSLDEEISLNKKLKHTLEIVVDRLVIKENMGKRLADSVETALNHGDSSLVVSILDEEDLLFSENLHAAIATSVTRTLNPDYFHSTILKELALNVMV